MRRVSALLAAAGLALLLAALPGGAPAADHTARGRALFAAKGCAMCHRHAAVRGSGEFADSGAIGRPPDLSAWAGDEAFLRRWLRDPAAERPGTQMPNPHLSEPEIEALVAFLRAGTAR